MNEEFEVVDFNEDKKFSVLDTYGENLKTKFYITDPAIGRDKEIKETLLILLTPEKSAMLVGKAGIGKTAIVEGIGYRMQKGEVPDALKDYDLIKEEYEVKLGSTVGDVFKQALDDNGLKYRGWENGYISTIQSPEGYWLGEFTNGKYSGWMYTVNGSHPSLGLNEYKLIGDEEIVWHYVDDYRQEVADWSESDKTGDGSL